MPNPTYGDPDAQWTNRDNADRSPRGVQRRTKARHLRQHMSLPKILLWRELRRNGIGWRFRRQHAIGPYVADFYCHEVRLIVEVDGESHIERRFNDMERDAWLTAHGYIVKRISAERVLKSPSNTARFLAEWMAAEFGSPCEEPQGTGDDPREDE